MATLYDGKDGNLASVFFQIRAVLVSELTYCLPLFLFVSIRAREYFEATP